jgi:shikimate kinase
VSGSVLPEGSPETTRVVPPTLNPVDHEPVREQVFSESEPGPGAQVVLVGAPGSGKSTVGVRLAEQLGLDFHDVDAVIESRVGKPVSEIFADDGEAVFRAFEEATTAELLGRPGVLALGGGAVLSPATRHALRGFRVVWLKVGAPNAARRVGLNEARPLLLGNVRGTLIRLLAERTPLYAEVATESFDTDDHDVAAVVSLIVAATRDARR